VRDRIEEIGALDLDRIGHAVCFLTKLSRGAM
jgi:hypothetical protein